MLGLLIIWGYEIDANTLLDENELYSIQRFLNERNIYVNVNRGRYQYKNKFYPVASDIDNANCESTGIFYGQYDKDYFDTEREALIAGIEYTLRNRYYTLQFKNT